MLPYNDSRLAPIELGASIFVKANKNLWRASEEFGLNLTDFSEQPGDSTLGIWDGKEFLLTVSYFYYSYDVQLTDYLHRLVQGDLANGGPPSRCCGDMESMRHGGHRLCKRFYSIPQTLYANMNI